MSKWSLYGGIVVAFLCTAFTLSSYAQEEDFDELLRTYLDGSPGTAPPFELVKFRAESVSPVTETLLSSLGESFGPDVFLDAFSSRIYLSPELIFNYFLDPETNFINIVITGRQENLVRTVRALRLLIWEYAYRFPNQLDQPSLQNQRGVAVDFLIGFLNSPMLTDEPVPEHSESLLRDAVLVLGILSNQSNEIGDFLNEHLELSYAGENESYQWNSAKGEHLSDYFTSFTIQARGLDAKNEMNLLSRQHLDEIDDVFAFNFAGDIVQAMFYQTQVRKYGEEDMVELLLSPTNHHALFDQWASSEGADLIEWANNAMTGDSNSDDFKGQTSYSRRNVSQ